MYSDAYMSLHYWSWQLWDGAQNSYEACPMCLHAWVNPAMQLGVTICTPQGASTILWNQFLVRGAFKQCCYFGTCLTHLNGSKNRNFYSVKLKNGWKWKPVTRAFFCILFDLIWTCGSKVMTFWMGHLILRGRLKWHFGPCACPHIIGCQSPWNGIQSHMKHVPCVFMLTSTLPCSLESQFIHPKVLPWYCGGALHSVGHKQPLAYSHKTHTAVI